MKILLLGMLGVLISCNVFAQSSPQTFQAQGTSYFCYMSYEQAALQAKGKAAEVAVNSCSPRQAMRISKWESRNSGCGVTFRAQFVCK
jgi:hypothetical protein